MSKKFLKVEDKDGLYRDTTSNAIINMDGSALLKARQNRQIIQQKKMQELRQQQKINNLEQEVSEIKQLLAQILGKLNVNN